MSYTVAIVIPPVPADDAAAWAVLDELVEKKGPRPPVFKKLHDRLTAKYPCVSSLPDDQVDDGVWSDGPLINNFGHRTAVLGVSYFHEYPKRREEEVLPFVIDTANALGLVVFDETADLIHRPDGMEGVTLELEATSALRRPTLTQITAAVDRLTPKGGPGFLILNGPGNDYAQAAGGKGVFTAEWREYSGKKFRHWVAGLAGLPSKKNVKILTYTVKENERLSASDVKTILDAFAKGKGRPKAFAWRDITEQFD